MGAYQVTITISKTIQVDENEVREEWSIPQDAKVHERYCNYNLENKINSYIDQNDMANDISDVKYFRLE